jgi:hypothetical protein
MARDYRKEYDNYHSSEKQKKNRAGRNLARRMMKKRVGIKGKDVHHKDGNPQNNSTSNLAITSIKYNRSRNA